MQTSKIFEREREREGTAFVREQFVDVLNGDIVSEFLADVVDALLLFNGVHFESQFCWA